MFAELLTEQDDRIAAFLILYDAINKALINQDRERIRRLEVKVDHAWETFADDKRELILEKLVKDGQFSPAALEMVRIFKGKILTVRG